MIHILATAPTGREFATADAINNLGGMAVVPRTVEEIRDKKRKHIMAELPAMHNYMFLSVTASQWHQINGGVMIRLESGHLKRVMVRTVRDILPQEWPRVQLFVAEIEMDYQHRMASIEHAAWEAAHPGTRPYLAPYNIGEKLPLLGGDLEAYFVRSLGTADAPMIEAEITMFGGPVRVTLDPAKVEKWAAE